ncbi:MAG: hypothetical protein Ta2G_05290 [Termitinemataceae bacterium]|nr:MAG: hypothetical protein Ta2G_05290 [Termitinemataceae bacterium]
MLTIICSAFAFLLSMYSLAIFLRIILSWFPYSAFNLGKAYGIICRLTDPYLKYFQGIKFLYVGSLDLAPIAAICFLSIVINIFFSIANFGKFTIGMLLASIINILWSAASFVLMGFIVIVIFRLIIYAFRINLYNAFFQAIDAISKPIIQKASAILFKGRIVSYRITLGATLGALVLISLVFSIAVQLLIDVCLKLPF